MKTEIRSIFDKYDAGNKLGMDEIHALMNHALELTKDFQRLTKDSIGRANHMLGEQYELAA